MSDDHDRGTFVHPEDGKTYAHPSSLQSAHHVGPDGKVVYSPAQISAQKACRAMNERDPREELTDEAPPFVSHVSPAAAELDAIAAAETEANGAVSSEDIQAPIASE